MNIKQTYMEISEEYVIQGNRFIMFPFHVGSNT